MNHKNITQKEVAEQLGVSVATVSRVLNDQPGVSSELRVKVLSAMQDLGYRPNVSARNLATAKSHAVAFVVHMHSGKASEDPFYSHIMTGAEAYLAQHDYHIILTTVDDVSSVQSQLFSLVQEQRVDGLILAGPHLPSPFIMQLLVTQAPVVLVDNRLMEMDVNCVLADNEGGAYAATRHLLDQGHKSVVFLSGPQDWISNEERVLGYSRALRGVGQEPRILHAPSTTMEDGYRLMEQALQQWPDLSAVCAVNDSVAIGAMRAARRAGRQVPQDVAFTGFDDISWASISEPSLTTVHIYKRRMGQLAAERLLDSIENPDASATRTIVATKLIVRESSAERM